MSVSTTIGIELKAKEQISQALGNVKTQFKQLGETVKQSTQNIKSQIDLIKPSLTAFGVGMGAVAGAIALVGKRALDEAGALERYRATLITVTGSAEEAGRMLEWAIKEATKTPFEVKGVIESTAIVMQFTKMLGWTGKEAQKWFPLIGDLASGMGKDLQYTSLVVGKALTGSQDALLSLRDQFGISAQALAQFGAEMNREGGIAVKTAEQQEKLREALEKLITQNFAGAMARQMDTFEGAMSNLRDTMSRVYMAIGKEIIPTFNSWVKNSLTPTLEKLENFIKANGQMVIAIGASVGAISLFGASLIALGLAIPPLIGGFSLLQKALIALATNPIVLVITALTTLGIAMYKYRDELSSLMGSQEAEGRILDKKIEKLKKEIDIRIKSAGEIKNQADTLSGLIKQYESLKDKVAKLDGRTQEAKKAKQELKNVIEKIAEITPTATRGFDEMGKAIDIDIKYVKNLTKELLEQYNIELKIAKEKAKVYLDDAKEREKQLAKSLSLAEKDYRQKSKMMDLWRSDEDRALKATIENESWFWRERDKSLIKNENAKKRITEEYRNKANKEEEKAFEKWKKLQEEKTKATAEIRRMELALQADFLKKAEKAEEPTKKIIKKEEAVKEIGKERDERVKLLKEIEDKTKRSYEEQIALAKEMYDKDIAYLEKNLAVKLKEEGKTQKEISELVKRALEERREAYIEEVREINRRQLAEELDYLEKKKQLGLISNEEYRAQAEEKIKIMMDAYGQDIDLQLKLMRIREDIADEVIRKEKETSREIFEIYRFKEQLRIDLMEDGLQKDIAQLELRKVEEIKSYRDSLAYLKASAEERQKIEEDITKKYSEEIKKRKTKAREEFEPVGIEGRRGRREITTEGRKIEGEEIKGYEEPMGRMEEFLGSARVVLYEFVQSVSSVHNEISTIVNSVWDGITQSISASFRIMRREGETFGDAIKRIWTSILASVIDAISAMIAKWLVFMALKGIAKAFGLELPSAQTRPGEYKIIPGPPQQPVPIIAHGGEVIGRPITPQPLSQKRMVENKPIVIEQHFHGITMGGEVKQAILDVMREYDLMSNKNLGVRYARS